MKSFSRVRLFATLCTVAHQAPLSMGFSRQEYWRGLPFPSPGDLPDQGWNPGVLHCRQTLEPLHWKQCRRLGFNPRVRKLLWRKALQPTPVFLLGESHGQRSLVNCIQSMDSQSVKELDMTEQLTLSLSLYGLG